MVTQRPLVTQRPSQRLTQRRSPAHHTHPVTLQGLGLSATAPTLPLRQGRAPTILKRTDPDFMTAILDELQRDAIFQPNSPLHQSVIPSGATSGTTSGAPLTFLQPVHRTFYIALLEAVCDAFEIPELQPRLDANQIHSAGLVVRRIDAKGGHEAWQTEVQPDGSRQRGWFPLTAQTADRDPDPAHQRAAQSTGNAVLDRQLNAGAIAREESVSRLYVAPPELCQHLKRTVLYGVIPVTSNEVSEVAPVTAIEDMANANQVNTAIQRLLIPFYYFRADFRAGLQTDGSRIEPLEARTLNATDADAQEEKVQTFINTLRQLQFHFQAFDNPALFSELNQISVQLSDRTKPLGQLLQEAAQVLVDRQPGQVELPRKWPAIAPAQSQRIANLLQGNLLNRLTEFSANEGRFEDNSRFYQVRAFIRLQPDPPCPPRIIWSDYSPKFQIAPWFANGDVPPVKIALPDILEPQTLKNLKPNVAFSVPPKLFNFLNSQDAKEMFKNGPKKDAGGIEIQWLCSFNIPIITLCAYLVLNIFLMLFNLVFWWIFIIKICIPIPKPKPKP
jgi:hypothetical protein